ncbi:MAG: hypothetical protein RMY16_20190 [Nostoc sp. DedQUE12b]|nr:hypothetical protein [Nostoc sp. DedQUE12b]MDZ7950097.1 hypothetical protein [Nostoc sp. DedQUE09]MDZ8087862.1 hypothetical protein [Nostoc sp. DedQUE12b]
MISLQLVLLQLNGENNLIGVASCSEYWVTIPSNYGSIWTVTTNT